MLLKSFVLFSTSLFLVAFLVGHIYGDTAFIEKYPHQVAIIYKNISQCGGSIISERLILTSGQCLNGALKELFVRAGSNFSNKGGNIFEVEEVFIHTLFDESTQDFDIALLKLPKKITFDESKKAVELQIDNVVRYDTCKAIAWNSYTSSLIDSSIVITEKDYCVDLYVTLDALITNRMLCLTFLHNGFCESDVGGPIICDNKLVGLRSWGYGCDFPEIPAVYTNTLVLREFIEYVKNTTLF